VLIAATLIDVILLIHFKATLIDVILLIHFKITFYIFVNLFTICILVRLLKNNIGLD
jgi:hypothetical protein